MTAVEQPVRNETWSDLDTTPRVGTGARIARRLFCSAIDRLDVTVHLAATADAPARTLGRGGPTVHVHRPDELFARLAQAQLIGFGEAYLTGAWDEGEDPAALGDFLTVLAADLERLVPRPLQWLRSVVVRRMPATHRGDRSTTQANVSHHYDLSNDLFALFLDPTMTYSSALFHDPARADAEDLVAAQHRKIDRLLDQADVGPGTRLLEIGTGWGELAVRAAARGARVHTITLSVEQQALAQERIAATGQADRVEVELCDYRALLDDPRRAQAYDAVVSVEMLEAVGQLYWATYFRTLDHVLAPGGKVALQAITMPHHRMLATRNTHTFITKHVFPGGALPSLQAIEEIAARHTALRVTDRFAMGPHYATTLRLWDEAFRAAADGARALGFDETFLRLWHFYLEYSRAGFASGYIDDHQVTLARNEAR
ncbi:cyclopropane-fatty-acyl-phospholipid synthase [Nocardioides thalensis]|uniref:Cyclopropane-fatty-acyl-phospholipid synthase n=1 Tax=Nocardioides thalensis TaxID=1914755 RepID=A0A853C4S3_9ACTN|nr:class I SAM-dependent methyltransferase [Nocardioides thalensis]NYJ02237.1 cyclopropane-fatty-acyl-phospholipid synthase [Nocardioides thalensis]